MRIVFAGTPEFAVSSLRAAARHHEVVAVYTQPDRPAGRGRGLAPSPVKLEAVARGIPVYQPESLKDAAAQQQLRDLQPDLMVVVAYGLILPKAVLAIPTHGCWNVHASLLPRWRGAAPIQRAIQAGDAKTGVCLMQMEAGLDTGPVLLHQELPIAATDTGGQLHDKLAELGAQVLSDGLGLLRAGIKPIARPQPEQGVTYAHKLDKAEARLDWAQDADALARTVRAFNPWPIAEATLAGERVRIHGAVALDQATARRRAPCWPPAAMASTSPAARRALRLRVLQREGARRSPRRLPQRSRDLRVGHKRCRSRTISPSPRRHRARPRACWPHACWHRCSPVAVR
jgi:methionyl-tRNA formyltransferase